MESVNEKEKVDAALEVLLRLESMTKDELRKHVKMLTVELLLARAFAR